MYKLFVAMKRKTKRFLNLTAASQEISSDLFILLNLCILNI